MEQSTKTLDVLSSNLPHVSIRNTFAFIGKLASGCFTLIIVSYFWTLMDDLFAQSAQETTIFPLYLLPLLAVCSLSFYLTAELLDIIGIKVSLKIRKATNAICVCSAWVTLLPIIIYALIGLGSGNPDSVIVILLFLIPLCTISGLITKRWARNKPFLASCLLLLTGSLCVVIAIVGTFVMAIIAAIVLLPIVLYFSFRIFKFICVVDILSR